MAAPQKVRSILIVEDEAMIALMLEDFIESLGHHLHGLASSVEEGCALAGEGDFDLAILDCNLGTQSVWPVADILDRRSIPFILSSGGSMMEVPIRHAGRPMLEKPYTIGSIADLIATVGMASE